MLPEQISHPGHDFNLDLEGSYSRSQLIPCAQSEGQGHSEPLEGLWGTPALPPHATAAQRCRASRWAAPDKQDTHSAISSVSVLQGRQMK